MDEFQDFVSLPVSAEDMLAKARSFGLGMVLAHQHLDQLPRELEGAVMANARSKVVFQTNAKDAGTFAREFGGRVDATDFQNLGKYEVICRLAAGDGISAPVTALTNPPPQRFNNRQAVLDKSRTTYGRPVLAVEAEIDARRHPSIEPIKGRRRPVLGATHY
jgi:hypothetical protein